jgi:hypothetical protein
MELAQAHLDAAKLHADAAEADMAAGNTRDAEIDSKSAELHSNVADQLAFNAQDDPDGEDLQALADEAIGHADRARNAASGK